MAQTYVVTVTVGENTVQLRYAQQNPALAIIPLLLTADPRPDNVQITVEDE